ITTYHAANPDGAGTVRVRLNAPGIGGPFRCGGVDPCDTVHARKDRGSRMATPTRPCPYCGAAVLMNAPACGTCGRPMPPMQAGAPGGAQPAKTMFGYAAPAVPQQPG